MGAVLIGVLLFSIYAFLSGYKDGILYAGKGAESFKWNEHILYVLERFVVALILLIGFYYESVVDIGVVLFCAMLGFSLWHNGAYYLSAGRILDNGYVFSSNSRSSTARIELTFRVRMWMFVISWWVLITYGFFRLDLLLGWQ